MLSKPYRGLTLRG